MQWLRIAHSKGYNRVSDSLHDNGNRASFWNNLFFKKLDYGPSPKKIMCQLTSVLLCSVFLVCWLLKIGQIGCPEMMVRNYHSTLHVSQISTDLTWRLSTVWFGASYTNLRQSHKFKRQIVGKNLVLHFSKYGSYHYETFEGVSTDMAVKMFFKLIKF